VTAVDDHVVDGDRTATVRFTTTSSDAAFSGLIVPTIRINVIDNDVAPPTGPVDLGALIGPLSNTFRDLGNPNSFFAGCGGPDTVGDIGNYLPGIGSVNGGKLVDPEGLRRSLVPGFSGVSPMG